MTGTRAQLRVRTREWERFAQKNAQYYICTDLHRPDPEAFWNSGEEIVAGEFLPVVDRYKIHRGTALEIGCGVGRLTLPISKHFHTAIGMDISAEMVSQAKQNARERGIQNAEFLTIGDPATVSRQVQEVCGEVDFIYSFLVFQHIDDLGVFEAYLKAVSELLSDKGLAYLQFDTRPESVLNRLKAFLPDPLLPRTWRRGIRRVRRNPAKVEAIVAASSLTVVESVGRFTDMHRYVIRQGSNSD